MATCFVKFGWLRGERNFFMQNEFSCGGLQPSELFSPAFTLPDGSRSGLNDQLLIPQGILASEGIWLYTITPSSHNMRTYSIIV
jgi:hypothetical protein